MKLKCPSTIVMVATFVPSLQVISFGQTEINKAALDQLLAAAQTAHSDALVIWKNGQPYGEWYFGKQPGKIEAMSATKSVVNLAIGRLLAEGKIKSLDQPVYEFYPEWNQGRKKGITLRRLLNHTSGLQSPYPTTDEIYSSPDFVQLALAAELSSDPGSAFFYNNKAVNLLAGIVQKASDKRMDEYVGEEIFKPLGITDFFWTLDRAGNPQGMAGLEIRPSDFAKVGQLVLNRGKWNGQQIIAASWFDISLRSGQPFEQDCGLLWWLGSDQTTYIVDDGLIRRVSENHAPAEFIDKLKTLQGRYESKDAYRRAVVKTFSGEGLTEQKFMANFPAGSFPYRIELGPITSYSARGYLGQWVVIVPKAELVAVRMVRNTSKYDNQTDGMPDFEERVERLTH